MCFYVVAYWHLASRKKETAENDKKDNLLTFASKLCTQNRDTTLNEHI
jgi:hypothetical protein